MAHPVQNTQNVTATAAPGDTIGTAPGRTGQAFVCEIFITKTSGSAATKLTLVHDIGSGHPNEPPGQHEIVSSWQIPSPGQQIFAATVTLFGHPTDPCKLTMFLDGGTVECVLQAQILRFG